MSQRDFDNTPLIDPLVEEHLDTVKMNCCNRGRTPADGSKFVKSVRLLAWERWQETLIQLPLLRMAMAEMNCL